MGALVSVTEAGKVPVDVELALLTLSVEVSCHFCREGSRTSRQRSASELLRSHRRRFVAEHEQRLGGTGSGNCRTATGSGNCRTARSGSSLGSQKTGLGKIGKKDQDSKPLRISQFREDVSERARLVCCLRERER